MFGNWYFAARYFADRYFGEGGVAAPVAAGVSTIVRWPRGPYALPELRFGSATFETPVPIFGATGTRILAARSTRFVLAPTLRSTGAGCRLRASELTLSLAMTSHGDGEMIGNVDDEAAALLLAAIVE